MGLYDSNESKNNSIEFNEIKNELFSKKILPYTVFGLFEFILIVSTLALSISTERFFYLTLSQYFGILFQLVFVIFFVFALLDKNKIYMNIVWGISGFCLLLSIFTFYFLNVLDDKSLILSLRSIFNISFFSFFNYLGFNSEICAIGNPILFFTTCFVKLDFPPKYLKIMSLTIAFFTLVGFLFINYLNSFLFYQTSEPAKLQNFSTSTVKSNTDLPIRIGRIECAGSYEKEKCEALYTRLANESQEEKILRQNKLNSENDANKFQAGDN
jgi:hypothetical protein